MLANILKGGVLFGLLGPVIGLLTIAVPTMAMSSNWSASAIVFLLPASYFVGGIPAVAAGILVGMARPKLRGVWAYLLAALIGTVCSVAYLLAVTRGHIDVQQSCLLGISGFAASLVCGYIFLKPPNKSFKPRPLRGSA
jgi:hypothetical protein